MLAASRMPLESEDGLISPVYRNLRGLPRLLIQTGGKDNLEDDGVRLAAQAAACGVSVTLTRYPECAHIWPVWAPAEADPASAAAVEEMADFVTAAMRRIMR